MRNFGYLGIGKNVQMSYGILVALVYQRILRRLVYVVHFLFPVSRRSRGYRFSAVKDRTRIQELYNF